MNRFDPPPSNIDPVVRNYLYQMAERLNMALSEMDGGVAATQSTTDSAVQPKNISYMGKDDVSDKKINAAKEELKSLIIKTAKIVDESVQEISTDLVSNYAAESDFGVYRENVDAHISEIASRIERTIEVTNGVIGEYINTTSGYIRQGVVGFDDQDVPIIGIAIGQDVTITGSKYTVNGKEYDTIDTRHNMSIWTTEKLSFYVNGAEVAYFANNALHVSRINAGGITMNEKWSIDHTTNGFVVRWIGGES